ncbi:MAG: hypothetical protein Q4C72_01140 [Eubacteriales bacterium]|nr:hypothetical protein [Eubacteriales bacterium]
MKAQKEKKLEELRAQLRPGEQVLETARFTCAANMCLFFAVAVAALIVGRVFRHAVFVVLLTNLLAMWMMVDAARALAQVRDSCVLVTNRRTFGVSGGKAFDLPHRKLANVVQNRVLFLDGGDARSSVVLRNLGNRDALYRAIAAQRG